jgi:8-oxo-dGTP pyrophosphatase MutT (NUDIX family)
MSLEPLLDRSLDPLELVELTQRWGVPTIAQTALTVADPFLTGDNQMLTKNGRRAEICYVMHRGEPAAGLLLHIKTFYPSGAYRLPTGGVVVGERVQHALAREIWEETGLTAGDAPGQVRLDRFLGVLGYDLLHRQLGPVEFATYFFLVQMPQNAALEPQDADEHIGGWEWTTPEGLWRTADVLDRVHERSAIWADWGHFRAAGHRFVGGLLTG